MANVARIEIMQTRKYGSDNPFWIEVVVMDNYSQTSISLGHEDDLHHIIPTNNRELLFLVLDHSDVGEEDNTIGDFLAWHLHVGVPIRMHFGTPTVQELVEWEADWKAECEAGRLKERGA